MVDGLCEVLDERLSAPSRSRKYPAAVGCVPWFTSKAVAQRLLAMAPYCVVVDKHRRTRSRWCGLNKHKETPCSEGQRVPLSDTVRIIGSRLHCGFITRSIWHGFACSITSFTAVAMMACSRPYTCEFRRVWVHDGHHAEPHRALLPGAEGFR